MNKYFGVVIKTAISGLLAFSIYGCAAAPVKTDTVFFPPAPEEPKIQFLKGINGAKDVEVAQTGLSSSLKSFATGEEGETRPISKLFGLRHVNGKLYACDLAGHSIVIIDAAKNNYTEFTGKGTGKLKKPVNVAVDSEGHMFVVDAGRNYQVIHFDADGDYVDTIDISKAPTLKAAVTPPPKKDDEPQIEYKPKATDVAVDDKYLYILDMNLSDIKVYNKKTDEYVKTIGSYTEGKGGLSMPSTLVIGDDNRLYVTNSASGSVAILEKDGTLVTTFGKLGDGFGEFARPKGIAVGKENRIFVADGGLQNVQVFDGTDKHRLLIFFGDPGLLSGSLNLPAGLTLASDPDALNYWQKFAAPGFTLEEIIFVANQAGSPKVSVYGLGSRPAKPEKGKPSKKNTEVAEASKKDEVK